MLIGLKFICNENRM